MLQIDSKRTKSIDDYVNFIVGNIDLFVTKIRKDVRTPLLIIIEAQNSWGSDLIATQIDARLARCMI